MALNPSNSSNLEQSPHMQCVDTLSVRNLLLVQADLAGRAVSKAQEVGGSVRLISRSDGDPVTAEVGSVLRDVDNNQVMSVEEIMESLSGFVQAQFFIAISFI